MGEFLGLVAALLSSLLGGTAVAATRYAVGAVDPLTLAMLRYGIGALCLAPVAVYAAPRVKSRSDVLATVGLGVLFFALFPYLFTLSLAYTEAARGSLALSSLPLLTLALGIALRRETFSWNRLIGILVAVAGLAYALFPRLDGSHPAAPITGDLIMVAAACAGATFNVLARPYIRRIGALSFTALGMCVGGAALALIAGLGGALHLSKVPPSAWTAIVYLGVVGCALTFLLWSVAIRLTSPALVALTVTVNPLTASFLGAALLHEPISAQLVAGLIAVLLGIAIATNLLRGPRLKRARA